VSTDHRVQAKTREDRERKGSDKNEPLIDCDAEQREIAGEIGDSSESYGNQDSESTDGGYRETVLAGKTESKRREDQHQGPGIGRRLVMFRDVAPAGHPEAIGHDLVFQIDGALGQRHGLSRRGKGARTRRCGAALPERVRA